MSRIVEVTVDHSEMKKDLEAILDKYELHDPIVILAVASQLLGMLVALQDASTTPEHAMQVVSENLAIGNATCAELLLTPKGSS